MNSDTPETDTVIGSADVWNAFEEEIIALSRRLERERNSAYKAIREAVNKYGSLSFGYNGDCGADVIINELDDFLSEHQPAPW